MFSTRWRSRGFIVYLLPSSSRREAVSLCLIHGPIRGQFLTAESLACILFLLVGIQQLRVSL